MCVHFISLTSQFPQAEVGSHQPWGAPPGLLQLWAGPRGGLGFEGTQGFRDVPAWCVWLGQVARVGVAAQERHLLLSSAVVSGVGERSPCVPRPAFWRGALWGGNQHQARRQILPLGGVVGVCPLPRSAGQLRVSFAGGVQSPKCSLPSASSSRCARSRKIS